MAQDGADTKDKSLAEQSDLGDSIDVLTKDDRTGTGSTTFSMVSAGSADLHASTINLDAVRAMMKRSREAFITELESLRVEDLTLRWWQMWQARESDVKIMQGDEANSRYELTASRMNAKRDLAEELPERREEVAETISTSKAAYEHLRLDFLGKCEDDM